MPERASVYEGSHLGVEVTAGTAVPAIVKLSGIQIDNTFEPKFKEVQSMGHKFPTTFTRGKGLTTAKASGEASFYDLIYMFQSLLGNATITTVTATKTFDWVWKPDPSCSDVFQTYTVEKGCGNTASKFNYGTLTSGGLKFNKDGIQFDGNMMGKFLNDGQTLSAGIIDLPVFPLNPDSVDVYYGTTPSAFLPFPAMSPTFTRLNRCMELSWDVADRRQASFYLDSSQTSFSAITETKFDNKFKLSLMLDSQAQTILTDMQNNTQKWIKVVVTGVPIFDDNTKFHTLEIISPVHTIASQRGDKDSVYAVDLDMTSVFHAGLGSGLQVAIRAGFDDLTDTTRLTAIYNG